MTTASPRHYHATGRCPYCGTAFDKELPHPMELVHCTDCTKSFVAIVSYSTDIRRVEGEAGRYTGSVNRSAVSAIRTYHTTEEAAA